MEQAKILVVDDEQDLCEILLYNLTSSGYEAEAAYSAEEALERVEQLSLKDEGYDLFLLDVMMPGLSGFQLAERLRHNDGTASTPIIFLTAKDTEDDMLHGFGVGADDYVKKPFSVREVMARVKAVIGRSRPTTDKEEKTIVHEGLVVDLSTKTVVVDGADVPLTKTEFELLCLLMTHRGQVFSRQEMLERVWPKDVVVTDRTVDVNITRMRKKIGPYSQYIVTRQGFGYCFAESLSDASR